MGLLHNLGDGCRGQNRGSATVAERRFWPGQPSPRLCNRPNDEPQATDRTKRPFLVGEGGGGGEGCSTLAASSRGYICMRQTNADL